MSETVNIKIGDKEYKLALSRHAASAISNAAGGFLPALRRIAAFDFAFFAFVIHAATSSPSLFSIPFQQEGIEKELLKHGLVDLVEGLSDYIGRLANGGKPMEPLTS
jgi:hypothetical protein